MNLPAAALRLARLGMPVFPCRQKQPLTNHGCKDGTTDTITLTEWWRRWPGANVGATMGVDAGMWALDVDGSAGRAALDTLCRDHEPLPRTVCQRTGSGGWHILYRYPEGRRIRNSAGRLGDHLDTRGDGGYIIVAPSIHPNGTPYRWCRGYAPWERQLAPAPAWLLDLVDPPRVERPAAEPVLMRRDDALEDWALFTRLPELCQMVEQAGEGQRNHTLNFAAYSAGQLLGGELLTDEWRVADKLVDAAVYARLPENEARQTVRSGLDAGKAQPWRPPLRSAS